jgi:S-methylmethionine-dependent homocysteine/selenocysteine methylase
MEMGESTRRAKPADEASAWLGARLGAGAPICLDGATGTELERRAENLATAGVDLILIETMNTVAESVVASRAARDTGLPFMISFVSWAQANLLSGEALAEAIDCALAGK